ncbi:MAG: archaeal proteasome endopeptidase complex subunit alpha [Candidatus Aenigmatarchaeota archaeon]
MPEFMGYDRAIVTFSPDGRLFQVEYAREAVKKGTTSIGIVFNEGVVLIAHKPSIELLKQNPASDKIQQIDDNIGAVICGFLADGRILVDNARIYAQIYRITYDEMINVEGIVRNISDRVQLYTQYGGVRPFGVALLVGGVDESGPVLFEIDPSATFYSWNAQAIGRGAIEALKVLKKRWKENLTRDEAIDIAISALKAAEKGINPSEVELAIITKEKYEKYYGEKDSKIIKKYW